MEPPQLFLQEFTRRFPQKFLSEIPLRIIRNYLRGSTTNLPRSSTRNSLKTPIGFHQKLLQKLHLTFFHEFHKNLIRISQSQFRYATKSSSYEFRKKFTQGFHLEPHHRFLQTIIFEYSRHPFRVIKQVLSKVLQETSSQQFRRIENLTLRMCPEILRAKYHLAILKKFLLLFFKEFFRKSLSTYSSQMYFFHSSRIYCHCSSKYFAMIFSKCYQNCSHIYP